MKLHWRPVPVSSEATLWDSLPPVHLDRDSLLAMFEVRDGARRKKSSSTSKSPKSLKLLVLDNKRSNAICIALKRLPPLDQIEAAISNMEEKSLDREGIDKLLLLLPTKEEVKMIREQQELYPSLPLGDAEQLLLLLNSIPSIEARLKLWAFKSDFQTMEREMWEPLKDLKAGMEVMRSCKTLHTVLSVVLAMGNILNRRESRGFQLDYLAKLGTVRDTAEKRSLIVHIVAMVRTNLAEATDLHSELGPLVRVARTNYTELAGDLTAMEKECAAALNYVSTNGATTQVVWSRLS